MEMFDLTGKVALVTGGNGGIGLGMAVGLAACGATVVLSGRDASKAKQALEAIDEHGGLTAFMPADVTKESECRKLIADTVQRFARLDILINNAGTTVRKLPQALSAEEWRLVLDTNLTSAFVCSQAAYPAMKAEGGGKIVNIGSMMSIFGAPYAAAYAASKGAIVQLTRSLATAWAQDNIQVNAVLPGWIDTDLTRAAREQVEGLAERVLARTPAGRWGKPGDMAGIGVFLASSASDFITGSAIPVDGGYSAQA